MDSHASPPRYFHVGSIMKLCPRSRLIMARKAAPYSIPQLLAVMTDIFLDCNRPDRIFPKLKINVPIKQNTKLIKGACPLPNSGRKIKETPEIPKITAITS